MKIKNVNLGLQSTNREVLINVCEQMHERTAKLLTQRSKASNCKGQQMTTQELTNLGLLVSIFGEETQALAGRQCSGLQLSLQSQTVIFVQSFHEENRTRLSSILERETWKKSKLDNSAAYAKLGAIPSLQGLFSKQNEVCCQDDHLVHRLLFADAFSNREFYTCC